VLTKPNWVAKTPVERSSNRPRKPAGAPSEPLAPLAPVSLLAARGAGVALGPRRVGVALRPRSAGWAGWSRDALRRRLRGGAEVDRPDGAVLDIGAGQRGVLDLLACDELGGGCGVAEDEHEARAMTIFPPLGRTDRRTLKHGVFPSVVLMDCADPRSASHGCTVRREPAEVWNRSRQDLRRRARDGHEGGSLIFRAVPDVWDATAEPGPVPAHRADAPARPRGVQSLRADVARRNGEARLGRGERRARPQTGGPPDQ